MDFLINVFPNLAIAVGLKTPEPPINVYDVRFGYYQMKISYYFPSYENFLMSVRLSRDDADQYHELKEHLYLLFLYSWFVDHFRPD